MVVSIEKAIRGIVASCIESYAAGFSDRHLSEKDDPEGVINMKIHNVFIAALGADIQYYSALARSLDSSLGNMLERMAIQIAKLNYTVSQYVEGYVSERQTTMIAQLLEKYKKRSLTPSCEDYYSLAVDVACDGHEFKRHDSDYYICNEQTGERYLIELKIGGDIDNKKARAEKEALLEQYCILSNNLNSNDKIKLCFATAYNRYGEGNSWAQGRVMQYFAKDELMIGCDFWNFICKSEQGYDIVIDEYRKNAHIINEALNKIKNKYLSE